MYYVLIIYLASMPGSHGGPVSAEFRTKEACEKAAESIKEVSRHYYRFHACVFKQ